MASYLVTGGCGFIGRHLVKALLDAGHTVRVLDNLSTGKKELLDGRASLMVGDITDRAALDAGMQDMDGCFHLAAIASVERSRIEWEYTHHVNLSGTVGVFASAARINRPVPVVYASSAAVYGDSVSLPLKESLAVMPLTAYGADKFACELHGQVAWLIHHVPAIGLRFFNVYGAGQDPASMYSGVISIFAERIKNGQELMVYGDGEQTRDFIFVADVVEHLLAAMRAATQGHHVLNVCTGVATSVNQLAHMIADVAEKPLHLSHAPARSGDIRASLGDTTQAKHLLGIGAQTPLKEGLKATLCL